MITTDRDNDRVECISEGHLQFMREYIRYEEETAKATLDRFLRERFKRAASVESKIQLVSSAELNTSEGQ
jgi:hypothetical protein